VTPEKIRSKAMKGRFANSTSYAAIVGIDKSYQYKCRICGVLFTRVQAYEHYPQDCSSTNPSIGIESQTLPPTIYPGQTATQPAPRPIAADQEPLSLDINDVAGYLEWITADRNQARRELESTREQLTKLREASLSREFWDTYREYTSR
tara:strand:- start:247 stop:693 length:447 start_codon:yes stop_codon:yes gene_type:complete